VTELRSAGIQDATISLMGSPDEDGSASEHDHDRHSKSNVAAGVAAGGVVGAILGVAALAIPGVGPLVAAGAIAASAVPTAAGVGAAVGATGGALAKMLSDHDVDGRDAEYYEERLQNGAIFVSVDARQSTEKAATARDILYANGGHSASRPKESVA